MVFLGGAVAGLLVTDTLADAGRGNGDFMSSHDLEDVLNIVDGRKELVTEMATAPEQLRQAVAAVFAHLLKNPDFVNVLPGLLAEPERAGLVMDRLKALSQ